MDPLSITASVIAVLQLTGEAIKYLGDVKDAPKECQQCKNEAENLKSLLINLLYHLNGASSSNSPWYKAVLELNNNDRLLDQYRQALEELLSKVEKDGLQMRLLWKFRKEDIASIFARMERVKSLVSIALEMDHL
jgi:hypothetical protein